MLLSLPRTSIDRPVDSPLNPRTLESTSSLMDGKEDERWAVQQPVRGVSVKGGKYVFPRQWGLRPFTFWLGSITGVTAIKTLIGVPTNE